MKVLTVFAHPNQTSFCHAILEQFTKGLGDAGHASEVVDLYAIKFDPVFRTEDFASYVHESMPADILEDMDLKKRVMDQAGNAVTRLMADAGYGTRIPRRSPGSSTVIAPKTRPSNGRRSPTPMGSPSSPRVLAPLSGHYEGLVRARVRIRRRVRAEDRGLGRGDEGPRAAAPPPEGARHQHHSLPGEDYEQFLKEPMTRIIDDWGLRYPGVKNVEHVYFYRVPVVDLETRRTYLEQAYRLGTNFFEEA